MNTPQRKKEEVKKWLIDTDKKYTSEQADRMFDVLEEELLEGTFETLHATEFVSIMDAMKVFFDQETSLIKGNSAGVWRKVSEGHFPEDRKDRFIKGRGVLDVGWRSAGKRRWYTDSNNEYSDEEVEWLDESPSSISRLKEKDESKSMIKNITEPSKGVYVIEIDDDYYKKLNEEMQGKTTYQILREAIDGFKNK